MVFEDRIFDVFEIYGCRFLDEYYVDLQGYDPVGNRYLENFNMVVDVGWVKESERFAGFMNSGLIRQENYTQSGDRNKRYLIREVELSPRKNIHRSLQTSSM